MKVKSTGLGKTQLTAHVEGFYVKEDGSSAVMVIESTQPVHWHIECDMGGIDLRHFAGFVLRPRVLFNLLKLLVQGGEAKGFVMEKEGGRTGRKAERAAKPAAAGTASATVVSGAAPAPAATDLEAGAGPRAAGPASEPARAAAITGPPARIRLEDLRSANGHGSGERSDREERRAERRRQRQQAAEERVTG